MKAKFGSILVSFFIASILSLNLASFVNAGDSYCKGAQVLDIGATDGGVMIFLKNISGNPVGPSDEWANGAGRWFYVDESISTKGLAIAMTAVSLGKQVKVLSLDGTFVTNAILKSVLLSTADAP